MTVSTCAHLNAVRILPYCHGSINMKHIVLCLDVVHNKSSLMLHLVFLLHLFCPLYA